jgi:hypothetical protein
VGAKFGSAEGFARNDWEKKPAMCMGDCRAAICCRRRYFVCPTPLRSFRLCGYGLMEYRDRGWKNSVVAIVARQTLVVPLLCAALRLAGCRRGRRTTGLDESSQEQPGADKSRRKQMSSQSRNPALQARFFRGNFCRHCLGREQRCRAGGVRDSGTQGWHNIIPSITQTCGQRNMRILGWRRLATLA